jgi:hypothetical protein
LADIAQPGKLRHFGRASFNLRHRVKSASYGSETHGHFGQSIQRFLAIGAHWNHETLTPPLPIGRLATRRIENSEK